MNKILILIPLLSLLLIPVPVSAEWGISDESILGTDFGIGYMENELVFEKAFDWQGFYVGFENIFAMENFRHIDFADEISIGFGFGFVDWLTLSLYQKMFIAAEGTEIGAGFGVDMMAVLGFEIEDKGFAVEDENEFVYNATGNTWEYVNTLGIDWRPVEIGDSLSFGFFFENELVAPIEGGSEPEDGMLIGPVIGNDNFSFGLFYALGLAVGEDAGHGIEMSLVFEL